MRDKIQKRMREKTQKRMRDKIQQKMREKTQKRMRDKRWKCGYRGMAIQGSNCGKNCVLEQLDTASNRELKRKWKSVY